MKKTKTIPCRICGKQTDCLGTELCNRCWELEHRIHADPELARRILEKIDYDKQIQAAIKRAEEKREMQRFIADTIRHARG